MFSISLVRLTFEYRVCLLTTEIGSPFTGEGAYQIDHPVTTVTLCRTAGWYEQAYTRRGRVWPELLAWLRSLAGPATTLFSIPKSGTFAN
jgi:hypothetical protein